MIITDAYWEERNLGVSTLEIQIENEDDINKIESKMKTLSAQYIVCKVPSLRADVTAYFAKHGYTYVEDMILVEHDLKEAERSKMHQRLYDAMSYREMTREDVEFLKKEIEGGLFSTDRITNDPYFDNTKASDRYINWVNDLIEQKALFYVDLYKNDPAGFVILQTKDAIIYNSVLGGGYEKYRNTGLGIVQKEQEIVRKLGGKRVETQVSSNNPGQLRALEINGYRTKGINHIFIKHND
ncbi:MAG: GNAT family N-acetyltransferase [Lachnospiraceae bacterium]|jgi:hypothetical protein|nr:GNAT family N-acetyltransferase [Lachnospiraceae bacterium]